MGLVVHHKGGEVGVAESLLLWHSGLVLRPPSLLGLGLLLCMEIPLGWVDRAVGGGGWG